MAALSARWQTDERAREAALSDPEGIERAFTAALSLQPDSSDVEDFAETISVQEESEQKTATAQEESEPKATGDDLEEEFFECASGVEFVRAHCAN